MLRVDAHPHQRRLALQVPPARRSELASSARERLRVRQSAGAGAAAAPLPLGAAVGGASCSRACARTSRMRLTRSRSFSQRVCQLRQPALRSPSCCSAMSRQPLGVIRADRRSRSSTRVCTARSSSCRVRVFDRRRRRVLPQRQARAGRVEHAHRLVRQLAVRQVAMREPHRRHRALRPGCARCGASPAPAPRRASSRSTLLRVGSSTFTSWKRRASAGSFSKYFLYSDHVVAAMVRSSPRASAGLSRLAASFCPACAAGADHRVRFVDEQDDRRRRRLHLLDQPLEAVLELAFDARARLQQRQVERAQRDVLAAAAARRRRRCAWRSLPPRPSCRRRPRR